MWSGPTDVEIVAIDILQVHGDRVFAWVVVIDVASPVRGEIRTAILIVLDLVFPGNKQPCELVYRFMRENKSQSHMELYTLRRDRQHFGQTTTSHPAEAEGATLQ